VQQEIADIMQDTEPQQSTTPTRRIFRNALREIVLTILPAIVLALFVNVFVAEAALVEEGPSMQPNLYVGYRVLTEKVSYRFRPPQRGDVVISHREEQAKSLIKRVMAVPGEVVEVRDGHTFINGAVIREPWVTHFGGPGFEAQTVPADRVFLLGDNRANSRDSRSTGFVPVEAIQGRAWLIYWPLEQIKLLP
jgi:signal peptidase I